MLPSACLDGVGTSDDNDYRAQYPACACPCHRSTPSLTADGVWLRVGMVRYTFPVRLFHPLHSSRLLALSKTRSASLGARRVSSLTGRGRLCASPERGVFPASPERGVFPASRGEAFLLRQRSEAVVRGTGAPPAHALLSTDRRTARPRSRQALLRPSGTIAASTMPASPPRSRGHPPRRAPQTATATNRSAASTAPRRPRRGCWSPAALPVCLQSADPRVYPKTRPGYTPKLRLRPLPSTRSNSAAPLQSRSDVCPVRSE